MFISSDSFLSSGVTAADFIESGTTPDCREEFMKSVMRGAMLGRSSFSNHVGIGSRAHALVEDFMTIRETSLIVTGTKTQSCRVARRQHVLSHIQMAVRHKCSRKGQWIISLLPLYSATVFGLYQTSVPI